jgi:hypothetical protein
MGRRLSGAVVVMMMVLLTPLLCGMDGAALRATLILIGFLLGVGLVVFVFIAGFYLLLAR